MRANLWMGSSRAVASTISLMSINSMRVNSVWDQLRAAEWKPGMTGADMKVISRTGRKTEKVPSLGPMGLCTLEVGATIDNMGLEYLLTQRRRPQPIRKGMESGSMVSVCAGFNHSHQNFEIKLELIAFIS
jgi:hypothetical protein